MIPIKNQPTSDDSNHPQAKLPNDKNQMKPNGSGIRKRNEVTVSDFTRKFVKMIKFYRLKIKIKMS